jgi:hypothetical protein
VASFVLAAAICRVADGLDFAGLPVDVRESEEVTVGGMIDFALRTLPLTKSSTDSQLEMT